MRPVRGLESLRDDPAHGVVIVPDGTEDELRADGQIPVSESAAHSGPVDFDG